MARGPIHDLARIRLVVDLHGGELITPWRGEVESNAQQARFGSGEPGTGSDDASSVLTKACSSACADRSSTRSLGSHAATMPSRNTNTARANAVKRTERRSVARLRYGDWRRIIFTEAT